MLRLFKSRFTPRFVANRRRFSALLHFEATLPRGVGGKAGKAASCRQAPRYALCN